MQYLTKKQLDEIARQLATNAKKDSDFEETTEITGDDFVAVVQDGINKKLNVNTFRNELQNGPQGESAYEVAVRHGFSGTEEQWLESLEGETGPRGFDGLQGPRGAEGAQGESGVSLGEIALTTAKAETTTGKALDASVAQYKIGFDNTEQEIEDVPSNYYNRQIVDHKVDILQAQIDNIEPTVIYGDVTNNPDNEDLTADSQTRNIKLKDRNGEDGMGYYILRNDKPFADQVVHANAIYEIRYDFDLLGSVITLPSSCILKFNGGSINNGTLALNGAGIWPNYDYIVGGQNLVISGNPKNGTMFFQNGIPTWRNGANWVDATGTPIQ